MKPTLAEARARLVYLRDRVLTQPEDRAAVNVVLEHLPGAPTARADDGFGNPFPPPPPPPPAAPAPPVTINIAVAPGTTPQQVEKAVHKAADDLIDTCARGGFG